MRALLLPVFLLSVPMALVACTKPTMTADPPAGVCTKANDQCRFADGKIGLCTASSMDCDGGRDCLVCMSLH